jgi:hypothetical protein
MGGIAFAGGLAVGAILLAVWADERFVARRPDSSLLRFVHAGVAFVCVQLAAALFGHVTSEGERLLIAFPLLLLSMVYAFMSFLWLVRTVAEHAGAGR